MTRDIGKPMQFFSESLMFLLFGVREQICKTRHSLYLQTKYYGDSKVRMLEVLLGINQLGCDFLVAGRKVNGTFQARPTVLVMIFHNFSFFLTYFNPSVDF